jgi:hypothetical protein
LAPPAAAPAPAAASLGARARRLAAANFVLSIALAIAWFAWQAASGLAETDPARLRVNRVPLGAAVLLLVQIGLYVLYRRRGELDGLVRVFALLLGVVQLLQSAVVGALAHALYGEPFPTAAQMVTWYLCASNLLFALVGPPRPLTPPAG